jgi:hypothetical protein
VVVAHKRRFGVLFDGCESVEFLILISRKFLSLGLPGGSSRPEGQRCRSLR